jgi:hypothetical protein
MEQGSPFVARVDLRHSGTDLPRQMVGRNPHASHRSDVMIELAKELSHV